MLCKRVPARVCVYAWLRKARSSWCWRHWRLQFRFYVGPVTIGRPQWKAPRTGHLDKDTHVLGVPNASLGQACYFSFSGTGFLGMGVQVLAILRLDVFPPGVVFFLMLTYPAFGLGRFACHQFSLGWRLIVCNSPALVSGQLFVAVQPSAGDDLLVMRPPSTGNDLLVMRPPSTVTICF